MIIRGEIISEIRYICTDKTGTLTKNEISVFKISTGALERELMQNMEVGDVGKMIMVIK